MDNETKFLTQKIENDKSIDSTSKDRVSTLTNDSDNVKFSDSSLQIREFVSISDNPFIQKCGQIKIKQPQISKNLHKKAINWLITFCWTRDFSQQILWYSIGFYYSYYYTFQIKKQQLTSILFVCVNLSLKLHKPKSCMTFTEIANMTNNGWKIQGLRQTQRVLLELFDFDLLFPTLLNNIYSCQASQEQILKTIFVVELLFQDSYRSAIDDMLLDDIMVFVNSPEEESQIGKEVEKLCKNQKFLEPLKLKYSSKFNVDGFLKEIIKSCQ